MDCPLCRTTLRSLEYEGVTIDACDQCGGEFLDADELGHIVRAHEEHFTPELRRMVSQRQPEFGVSNEAAGRSIGCPKCGSPMEVINYCGDSGIYVDRCTFCGGFWLDADELDHVQVFQEEWEIKAPKMIQAISGELEQARREAAERTNRVFSGSRFAFVNALINHFIDAA